MDRVADHLPEFAQRGKGEITLHQVMTHQGGFPSGDVTQATWTDHARMRAEVCDFSLDWTPGTRLQYHPRAAHLTQAMVIEAVTGRDYRDVIRDNVLAPLGLAKDIFVGVPPSEQERCADTYAPEPRDNSAEFKAAGMPSGGGYATARGMAAFYQMLLGHGRLGNVRLLSPRLVSYVSRSHTGEMRRRRDGRHSDASRAWGRMCAATATASAVSARSARRRLSGMAAPAPPIPGPTRRAVYRSPISRTSRRPIPGIRPASTGSPTSCTPPSIDRATRTFVVNSAQIFPKSSFPRKREPRAASVKRSPWTPASAGVTGKRQFSVSGPITYGAEGSILSAPTMHCRRAPTS